MFLYCVTKPLKYSTPQFPIKLYLLPVLCLFLYRPPTNWILDKQQQLTLLIPSDPQHVWRNLWMPHAKEIKFNSRKGIAQPLPRSDNSGKTTWWTKWKHSHPPFRAACRVLKRQKKVAKGRKQLSFFHFLITQTVFMLSWFFCLYFYFGFYRRYQPVLAS